MSGKRAFELIYDPEFKNHLQLVEPKYRSLIRSTIEEQLAFSRGCRNAKSQAA